MICYLFLYDLFSNNFNTSVSAALDDRAGSEQWIGRIGKAVVVTFRYFSESAEENQKKKIS
jgi:hypothetical protein